MQLEFDAVTIPGPFAWKTVMASLRNPAAASASVLVADSALLQDCDRAFYSLQVKVQRHGK